MWRWPVIAAKKEKSAKAKAKINTLHARLIAIAAQWWSDPNQNNTLLDAIRTAKKDGVTSDVIDRAIARGAGLDKESSMVETVIYEWYAVGGVAVIVRALTDNRNRTASNIRHIFSAFWGNLAETWAVSSFLFDYQGVITLTIDDDVDSVELAIIETSAQDYHIEWNNITIMTDSTQLIAVRDALVQQWYTPKKASLEYIPKNYIEVTDFDAILKIYKMFEAFDQDEDVELLWNNADISDGLWHQAQSKIEENTFRT